MRTIVLYYAEWPGHINGPDRAWISADGDWRVVAAGTGRCWLWASRRNVSMGNYKTAADAARRLARHAGARVTFARDRRWVMRPRAESRDVAPPPSHHYQLRGRHDLRVLTGALRIPDPEAP